MLVIIVQGRGLKRIIEKKKKKQIEKKRKIKEWMKKEKNARPPSVCA